ncbi:MAG: glucose-1-phosphate thymidylyltransferase [Cyclobacteriaceae bacterium]|nr:glucose-1-phosphate thymidylyltransferase [Cyclobacteriaceae bacterium]
MNISLVDLPLHRTDLMPLTYTRPVSELRVGILTLTEKWKFYGAEEISWITEPYLRKKFPLKSSNETIVINGALCPSILLVKAIQQLKAGQALYSGGNFLAAFTDTAAGIELSEKGHLPHGHNTMIFNGDVTLIGHHWDIFNKNAEQIQADFNLITKGRKSQPIEDPHTIAYRQENIFLEEGATVKAAILNAETGPIYLGKHSEVGEGAVIRGSFSLGEHAVVSIGAKMRGDISAGPYAKIGGEVGNSVIFGYSNKAHDGYMGNTVVGEWCNFGADTNTSNLKNTYDEIKLWSYTSGKFVKSGQQFLGLVMADHSKCGINTMFNSGTVVGVSTQVLGEGYHRNVIPSFTWASSKSFTTVSPKQCFDIAERVFARRKKTFSEIDRDILLKVFELTQSQRTWEKA